VATNAVDLDGVVDVGVEAEVEVAMAVALSAGTE
jgi:hypothetical protein